MPRLYRNKNMNNVEMSEWMRSQCDINKNGCWVWKRYKTQYGYGQVGYEGKPQLVHRLYWTLVGLVIHDGEELWHNIDCNKACFNPEHLDIQKSNQIE